MLGSLGTIQSNVTETQRIAFHFAIIRCTVVFGKLDSDHN